MLSPLKQSRRRFVASASETKLVARLAPGSPGDQDGGTRFFSTQVPASCSSPARLAHLVLVYL